MYGKLYRYLLAVSSLLIVIGLLLAVLVSDPRVQAFGAVASGVGASLLASTIIQDLASCEQSTLLREVTLAVEGTKPLPDNFKNLTWNVYPTRVPDQAGEKRVIWRIAKLKKLAGSGQTIAFYEIEFPTPEGGTSLYQCTFLGLTGCVLAIAAKGNKLTSVTTFDTPIADNGIYFGFGYITDWFGDRCSTIEIVGVGNCPKSVAELRSKVFVSFQYWYKRVGWNTQEAFDLFREST